MFKNVFFFLFTHFSVGLVFTILMISRQEIGKLFFRVTTLLASGLIVVALAAKPFGAIDWSYLFHPAPEADTLWPQLSYWFLVITAFLLLVYNVVSTGFHKFLLAASFLTGLAGISCFSLVTYRPAGAAFAHQGLFVTNGITATLLLGSVLGAMITGHWYLVQHKLSLTPLKNSTRVYLLSVFSRTGIVVASLLLTWNVDLDTSPSQLLTGLSFNSFVFFLRIGFGLIIPLIFGLLICSAVTIRSTQSATGMLYATIVLILIGETFARFLYFSVGIPL
ncbi:MAG: hypothetical protein ACE5IY_02095 [bacterium]